jgi:hypothetical protein
VSSIGLTNCGSPLGINCSIVGTAAGSLLLAFLDVLRDAAFLTVRFFVRFFARFFTGFLAFARLPFRAASLVFFFGLLRLDFLAMAMSPGR